MKSKFLIALLCTFGFTFTGCGYTTSSTLPTYFRTIHVEQFNNKIDYATEKKRNLYIPLLESDIRNAVIDRYLFDGNLRIADPDEADLILRGSLLNYERDALRFTDNDDVEEYRVRIVVSLELWDTNNEEIVWTETGFGGEGDFFLTGPSAQSEEVAIDEAILDLARRIVERTIENW